MNDTNRRGKIARLPRAVREELNGRLENGQSGTQLLEWLNGLPEVAEVVSAEFEGKPVTEQNLSQWRQGGFLDWVTHQQTLEVARQVTADAGDFQQCSGEGISEHVAVWLMARYAVAARKNLDGGPSDSEREWKLLREFCRDLVAVRRGDHHAARMKMEMERMKAKMIKKPIAEY